jgi:hypothetical protein
MSGQLGALIALRWRMVRTRRVRLGLLFLLALLPSAVVSAVIVGQSLPPGKRLFDLLLLAPTLYVVFAALAVIAPLVAGGGNELFPEGQLVAYPIAPRTVFVSGLLMAPLNLAWVTQVVALVGATAAVSQRGPKVLLGTLTVAAYVAAVTTGGQALAWYVVGIRHHRAGRLATRGLGAALALGGLALVASGSTTKVLDRAPTSRVVLAAIDGSAGNTGSWAIVTLVLVGLCLLLARLGRVACSWALRRTVPVGRPELAPVVRRPGRRTALAELVAVDRASVWRSSSLRRGALVLAVLPGAVAMLAHPTWESLALLPGLVAAGAGLLFGVNAFCLDGAGAMWVATLPHPPRTTLHAKLWVIGQTCLGAVALAVVLAAVRVRDTPSAAELVALLGSAVGSTLLVVAVCARLSVTRPHKADLRGPRDTPAPPATMAVYSLRLALGTTWAGLAFTGAGASGSWVAALSAAVLVLALAVRSLLKTLRYWSDPVRQAQVVTTVSYG